MERQKSFKTHDDLLSFIAAGACLVYISRLRGPGIDVDLGAPMQSNSALYGTERSGRWTCSNHVCLHKSFLDVLQTAGIQEGGRSTVLSRQKQEMCQRCVTVFFNCLGN